MNTFELTIQRKSGEVWPVVAEYVRAGVLLPTRTEGSLRLPPEILQKLIQCLGDPRAYGTVLGQALFADASLRDAFIGALRESEERLRILLAIEADDTDLKGLRWERLCGPIGMDHGWDLLALDQRTPFSFYLPSTTDRRFPPIGRQDLQALVLVASPRGTERFNLAPFDVEATVASIRTALGEIPCDVLARVAGASGPPSLDALCERLTDRTRQYTLLHVVSHGRLIEAGETVVYWADADNRVQPLTGTVLLERLGRIRGPRGLPHFVFLSTCESASPEAERAFGGLAQRLVRDLGIPAVVAMTAQVTIATAQALAAQFYQRLRASGEVDLALPEATASLGGRADITIPALFSRLGGRPLFSDQIDRELTNTEIQTGVDCFRELLTVRAPVLRDEFERRAETLTQTLGAEAVALSPEVRGERAGALRELNKLAEEVLDLNFNALALKQTPPVYDARCPFQGLYAFQTEDREFFFGREALIAQLSEKLAVHRFLAVLGPSGSGKSSVVLAGLIPALQRQSPELRFAYLTPGNEPLQKLAAHLPPAFSVLVVDQFEELFTLCTDKAKRSLFIARLLSLPPELRIVVTMRADFWGECASYPALKDAMQAHQELVAPMSSAELRSAMEQQAAQVGLRFEAGLSNLIMDAVEDEPGAMPLLQHLLLELWKRRHGRWLKVDEYNQLGGIRQAIAHTADTLYSALPAEEQALMRHLFLRLTRLDDRAGPETRDTRCRVLLSELTPSEAEAPAMRQLVEHCANARLVVTRSHSESGQTEVEVAHEALIRYWPKLRGWLSEDFAQLHLRQDINQAAKKWREARSEDRESYLDHRGRRLEEAEALLQRPGFLNQDEAEYVRACVDSREALERQRMADEQEKEAQRWRELEMAKRNKHLAERNKWLAVGGFSFAAVAAGFLIFAVVEWRKAKITQIQALLESSNAELAANNELDARIASLKAGLILNKFVFRNLWPGKELISRVQGQLAQRIYDAGHELNRFENASVSFSSNRQYLVIRETNGLARLWTPSGREIKLQNPPSQVEWGVEFSPNEQYLAMEETNGPARLWTTHGQEIKLQNSPNQSPNQEQSVSFSPNGQYLYLVGFENRRRSLIRLWSINGQEVKLHNPTDLEDMEFSPNGQYLVAWRKDNIRLWTITGQEIKLQNSPGQVSRVIFSPKGQYLMAWEANGPARLWTTHNGQEIKLQNLPGQFGEVTFSFSPDEQCLAQWKNTFIGRNDIQFWTTHDGQEIKLKNLSNRADWVEFSPIGQYLAIREIDGPVRLASTSGKEIKLQNPPSHVNGVNFSPNGQYLAITDEKVRLWTMSGKEIPLPGQQEIRSYRDNLIFSPDGQYLAVQGVGVHLWTTAGELIELRGQSGTNEIIVADELEFSPNGQYLVTHGASGKIRVWTAMSGQEIILKDLPSQVPIVFSPDDQYLVAGESDYALLWKMADHDKVIRLRSSFSWKGHAHFSPDGHYLAMEGDDGSASLWNTNGQEIKFQGNIDDVDLSPDGQHLMTKEANMVRLWTMNGQEIKFQNPPNQVQWNEFSLNGQYVAMQEVNGLFRLWAMSGEEIKLQNPPSEFYPLEFSPNGKYLAVRETKGSIRLWNMNGEEVKLRNPPNQIESFVFSSNGQYLAAPETNGPVRVWTTSGEEIKFLIPLGQFDQVTFSPNEQFLVMWRENSVRLWTIKGQEIKLQNPPSRVVLDGVIFSPNGQYLAVRESDDGPIRLWTSSGQEIKLQEMRIGIFRNIAFSPDGQYLAAWGEGFTSLWSMTGQMIPNIKGGRLEFSPTGRYLATGWGETIWLWTTSGQEIKLQGEISNIKNISSMKFSPNEQYLAIPQGDRNALSLWSISGSPTAVLNLTTVSGGEIHFSPNGQYVYLDYDNAVSSIWQIGGLDELISRHCDLSRNYLKYNPNVNEENLHLCDDIAPASPLLTKITTPQQHPTKPQTITPPVTVTPI